MMSIFKPVRKLISNEKYQQLCVKNIMTKILNKILAKEI